MAPITLASRSHRIQGPRSVLAQPKGLGTLRPAKRAPSRPPPRATLPPLQSHPRPRATRHPRRPLPPLATPRRLPPPSTPPRVYPHTTSRPPMHLHPGSTTGRGPAYRPVGRRGRMRRPGRRLRWGLVSTMHRRPLQQQAAPGHNNPRWQRTQPRRRSLRTCRERTAPLRPWATPLPSSPPYMGPGGHLLRIARACQPRPGLGPWVALPPPGVGIRPLMGSRALCPRAPGAPLLPMALLRDLADPRMPRMGPGPLPWDLRGPWEGQRPPLVHLPLVPALPHS